MVHAISVSRDADPLKSSPIKQAVHLGTEDCELLFLLLGSLEARSNSERDVCHQGLGEEFFVGLISSEIKGTHAEDKAKAKSGWLA